MGCTVQAGLAALLTLIWTPPKESPRQPVLYCRYLHPGPTQSFPRRYVGLRVTPSAGSGAEWKPNLFSSLGYK